MKRKITTSTWFDNLIGFLWCVFVLAGTSYLVFFKGENAWWFALAVVLLSVSVYSKKEEIEE